MNPPAPSRPIPNDRVFIVGNGFDTIKHRGGTPVDSNVRSNAFEVTNRGTSIDYANNGSGGATFGALPPFNGATYGARSQDNTNYGWGDTKGVATVGGFPAHCTTFSDYGIDSVSYLAIGQYRVYLNTVDPYSGSSVTLGHGFSVTATATPLQIGPPCAVAVVTQITGNHFDIFVYPCGGGSTVDGEVMFHVFGRE